MHMLIIATAENDQGDHQVGLYAFILDAMYLRGPYACWSEAPALKALIMISHVEN